MSELANGKNQIEDGWNGMQGKVSSASGTHVPSYKLVGFMCR
jgi:hypothetical protein